MLAKVACERCGRRRTSKRVEIAGWVGWLCRTCTEETQRANMPERDEELAYIRKQNDVGAQNGRPRSPGRWDAAVRRLLKKRAEKAQRDS